MNIPVPCVRIVASRHDTEYIYSRNTVSQENLLGKKITVVGAGALGGYVTMSLAKLGAGQGGGRLRIVDYGVLEVGNLGRHILSRKYIGCSKSIMLAHEVIYADKYTSCIPIHDDARNVEDLFEDDLVIDATGEQGLSTSLNKKYLNHMRSSTLRPVLIHAWIKGEGQAVQALLVTGEKPCFDCLFTRKHLQPISDRFPILKSKKERRRIGCDLMTPYNNAAPQIGAGLVTQLISDWLRNIPEMTTFRTLYLENSPSEVEIIPNIILTPAEDCPSCSV